MREKSDRSEIRIREVDRDIHKALRILAYRREITLNELVIELLTAHVEEVMPDYEELVRHEFLYQKRKIPSAEELAAMRSAWEQKHGMSFEEWERKQGWKQD